VHNSAYEELEPDEEKFSSPVLKGLGGGNTTLAT